MSFETKISFHLQQIDNSFGQIEWMCWLTPLYVRISKSGKQQNCLFDSTGSFCHIDLNSYFNFLKPIFFSKVLPCGKNNKITEHNTPLLSERKEKKINFCSSSFISAMKKKLFLSCSVICEISGLNKTNNVKLKAVGSPLEYKTFLQLSLQTPGISTRFMLL